MFSCGKEETSAQLGRTMKKEGFPFNFKSYRHHQRGLVKHNIMRRTQNVNFSKLERFLQDLDTAKLVTLTPVETAQIIQAGHTARTAQTAYARFGENYDGQWEEFFRLASRIWQKECGIEGSLNKYPGKQSSCASSPTTKKRKRSDSEEN